ncbi:IclR family transcriptional regulator [Streptomyces jeddahensis]|uniref:HTH-type transcriptional regulator KipR n=1 Tax=Streptomyces jeddahensis TaxID=1716141 RepID=A0A177I0Z6_9ACTN|nr:IclR family transcriptional regulator [Streptomyces jeddahensis]OAH16607.1 HTH-type transcriptional regulator KipR [Streptomyces jeddahensis]
MISRRSAGTTPEDGRDDREGRLGPPRETAGVPPQNPETTPRSAPDRLLAVLGAFDHAHPALSLTDISRRAGLSLTTAHRLVGALTAWGALERDPSGIYHVGLRLWEVAALAPRGLALRQVALPYLEDLYEATHENVQLAVRDGSEVVYIEWISGRSAVGVRIKVGARWPLHATGVGLALLAHTDPEFQAAYCAEPLAAFTAHTITDPARLRRVLAEVRRTGCAVSTRQVTDDAVSVAAPVRGRDGTVAAAVSVVVPVQDAQVPALIPSVRLAARGISRALGWHPERPQPPEQPDHT